MTEYRR